jgi:hypothetical protein
VVKEGYMGGRKRGDIQIKKEQTTKLDTLESYL